VNNNILGRFSHDIIDVSFLLTQHDYHMAVYGAILGGMEAKGREVAEELNSFVNENMFREHPNLVAYLEAYSALEIHIMVRFGRWKQLLEVELPADKHLMLYRTASIQYGRALAFAMTGDLVNATKEADRFDTLRRGHPDAHVRILHNNTVADLLQVDATMLRGEIAYRQGKHEEGLTLLRKAVDLQENLNYDEPWGKMQPIRHALGGLLVEQGHFEEAEGVFRKDLKFHPRNPWALVGLIRCLKLMEQRRVTSSGGGGDSDSGTPESACCGNGTQSTSTEIAELEEQLRLQRQMEWADFNVVVSCECCIHPE
jgi:tetratricopeptide (TPR) repeat protein